MKATINKDLKVVASNKVTNFSVSQEIIEKIELQTNITILILHNDELIFSRTFEQVLSELRSLRDKKIAYLDYYVLSDTTGLTTTAERTAIKAKRQYIRDITEGLTTVEQALRKIKELNKLV